MMQMKWSGWWWCIKNQLSDCLKSLEGRSSYKKKSEKSLQKQYRVTDPTRLGLNIAGTETSQCISVFPLAFARKQVCGNNSDTKVCHQTRKLDLGSSDTDLSFHVLVEQPQGLLTEGNSTTLAMTAVLQAQLLTTSRISKTWDATKCFKRGSHCWYKV